MLYSASSVTSMARSMGPLGTMRIVAAKVWHGHRQLNLKWDLAGHFSKPNHHVRTYPEHRETVLQDIAKLCATYESFCLSARLLSACA